MPCADCQSSPAENPIAGTLADSRTLPNVSSLPRCNVPSAAAPSSPVMGFRIGR